MIIFMTSQYLWFHCFSLCYYELVGYCCCFWLVLLPCYPHTHTAKRCKLSLAWLVQGFAALVCQWGYQQISLWSSSLRLSATDSTKELQVQEAPGQGPFFHMNKGTHHHWSHVGYEALELPAVAAVCHDLVVAMHLMMWSFALCFPARFNTSIHPAGSAFDSASALQSHWDATLTANLKVHWKIWCPRNATYAPRC